MGRKYVLTAVVVALLTVGAGFASVVQAQVPVNITNFAPCNVTFSALLSDGSVKGPATLPPGGVASGSFPVGLTILGFFIGAPPVFVAAPGPGLCVPTGLSCPTTVCNLGGFGLNYGFF